MTALSERQSAGHGFPPAGSTLTDWDGQLLQRYLPFYEALAQGLRQPINSRQAHFVACAIGAASATTQHELAFQRHRQRLIGHRATRQPQRSQSTIVPSLSVESAVDLADDALLRVRGPTTASVLRRVRGLYTTGRATATRASSDAALWVSTALADAGLSRQLESWTSVQFGELSNIYTRALDGDFAKGLRAGVDNVNPLLHRLLEGSEAQGINWGGHTLGGALAGDPRCRAGCGSRYAVGRRRPGARRGFHLHRRAAE